EEEASTEEPVVEEEASTEEPVVEEEASTEEPVAEEEPEEEPEAEKCPTCGGEAGPEHVCPEEETPVAE
ncbi:DNA primase, partial [Candidatus Woesearchaeota archaeon]|nr:DNA primase [Candidatus Woesearchaeota archaeon]